MEGTSLASQPDEILTPRTARHDRLTGALRLSLAPWADLFRPSALHGIVRIAMTSAPAWRDADLLTLSKLGAWICAFDDLVDDSDLSDADVRLRIAQYERLICGHDCPELAFDPVAVVLDDLTTTLLAAPLGRALWPLFVAQLTGALEAMAWERDALARRRAGLSVSAEMYLDQAATSSCMGLCIVAAAMLIGESPAAEVPALFTCMRHAGMAMRIANDVATWPREQHEHNAANVLMFVPDGGVGLQARLAGELRGLTSHLGQLRQSAPQLAKFIERFTFAFVRLYRTGDL